MTGKPDAIVWSGSELYHRQPLRAVHRMMHVAEGGEFCLFQAVNDSVGLAAAPLYGYANLDRQSGSAD
jgi:hypothetical protein